MRGDLETELRVLMQLGHRCGQLWLYPDTGAPALVVDAALDIDEVAALYGCLVSAEDGWEQVHWQLYGPQDPERNYYLTADPLPGHKMP